MASLKLLPLFFIALSLTLVHADEDEPNLATWKTQLSSPDEKVQEEAIRQWLNSEVGRKLPADELIPLLLPIIKSYKTARSSEAMRGLMIEHLGRGQGPKARAALPELMKLALDDKATSYLRGQAIEALGWIGPKDPEVIAALIKVLENPKPTSSTGVHDRACAVLGKMGKAAESARPAISKWLKHEWDMHQDAAYIALGRIAEDELALPLPQQIERLKSLKEHSTAETSAAFLALEAAGVKKDPQAKLALNTLAQIIAEQGKTVYQRAAIRVVLAVGPGSEPSMVRALLQAVLKDHASYASNALVLIEGTNPEAVTPLIEAFQVQWNSKNWTDAYYVSNALQRFGAHARPATPWLIKALLNIERITSPHDAYIDQAESYIQVLNNIGAQEPEILPTYLALLAPDSTLRKNSGALFDPLRCTLYAGLATLGIPKEGSLRATVLERIMEGLNSDEALIFNSAAITAATCPMPEMIPLLMRAFDPTIKFKAGESGYKSMRIEIQITALNTLSKLGPLAKLALPKASELAQLPIPEPSYDPLDTQKAKLIETARKAQAAFEKQ